MERLGLKFKRIALISEEVEVLEDEERRGTSALYSGATRTCLRGTDTSREHNTNTSSSKGRATNKTVRKSNVLIGG